LRELYIYILLYFREILFPNKMISPSFEREKRCIYTEKIRVTSIYRYVLENRNVKLGYEKIE